MAAMTTTPDHFDGYFDGSTEFIKMLVRDNFNQWLSGKKPIELAIYTLYHLCTPVAFKLYKKRTGIEISDICPWDFFLWVANKIAIESGLKVPPLTKDDEEKLESMFTEMNTHWANDTWHLYNWAK
jgi:hypothetical protein